LIPSPTIIWDEYLEFQRNLPDLCAISKWVVSELTFDEYSTLVTSWLALSADAKYAGVKLD